MRKYQPKTISSLYSKLGIFQKIYSHTVTQVTYNSSKHRHSLKNESSNCRLSNLLLFFLNVDVLNCIVLYCIVLYCIVLYWLLPLTHPLLNQKAQNSEWTNARLFYSKLLISTGITNSRFSSINDHHSLPDSRRYIANCIIIWVHTYM